MPHARAPRATVEERVSDLHRAFGDPDVKMIVASIGGDDSLRLLPRLDRSLLAANPKVVMGYSDTTTLLTYLVNLGQLAFHGPAVMAGFAQAGSLPDAFLQGVRAILFEASSDHRYEPFSSFSDGYEDWSNPANAEAVKPPRANSGLRLLQGSGVVRGRLLGGCLEVLDMIRGTPYWPAASRFDGAVILLEGSEEAPPPARYRRTLRSFAVAGHLERASALVVGRARGLDDASKRALEEELLAAAAEAGRTDLVVIANADFGHTDPQWVLPLGALVAIDADARTIRLAEAAVT
jgi:muramoyltetrapeptide carboxypeptidase LdcA involved in peptidoglycan recycling